MSVRDVRFSYRKGGEELYNGFSYDFEPGSLTSLTGPSGTGKSTLLYILGLLLTPTSGTVSLGGKVLSGERDSVRSLARATKLGFVFQDSELDPTRTIMDSVMEPALYSAANVNSMRRRARELLAQFGLDHRSDHRPGEISGGQAQRVAICRALTNSPEVILADEPTGNLDRGNAELVLQALRHGADEGRTVIIATHDPFVIEWCDDGVDLS